MPQGLHAGGKAIWLVQVARRARLPAVPSGNRAAGHAAHGHGRRLEAGASALKFSPRTGNNSKCALHERRIQIASAEAVAKLGFEFAEVRRGPIAEFVTANGEIDFDQTRVARLSPRVAGTLVRVEKQEGDRVRAGDVLAIIDAVEIGKAKAEYLQALAQADLKSRTLAALKAAPATVSGQDIAQAEAVAEEARIGLINAEQTLANLDLPVRTESLKSLAPDEIARQVRFLGLPAELQSSLDPATASGNLIAIRAPLDGTIISRTAAAGQAADPARGAFRRRGYAANVAESRRSA